MSHATAVCANHVNVTNSHCTVSLEDMMFHATLRFKNNSSAFNMDPEEPGTSTQDMCVYKGPKLFQNNTAEY